MIHKGIFALIKINAVPTLQTGFSYLNTRLPSMTILPPGVDKGGLLERADAACIAFLIMLAIAIICGIFLIPY